MNKLNFKEVFIPTIALFLICAITTALLAITNDITSPMIADIQKKNQDEACRTVLPSASSFTESTVEYNGNTYTFYLGADSNNTVVGCVIITSAKGYGGDISVMTGLSLDGAVTGVQILSMNETPGLGANASKESFLSQYNGSSEVMSVTKDGGSIDSLTGATITSRAVTQAVNEAIEVHNSL